MGENRLGVRNATDYGIHSAHHKPGSPPGTTAMPFLTESPFQGFSVNREGRLAGGKQMDRSLAQHAGRESHRRRLLVLCNDAKPLERFDSGLCTKRERVVSEMEVGRTKLHC